MSRVKVLIVFLAFSLMLGSGGWAARRWLIDSLCDGNFTDLPCSYGLKQETVTIQYNEILVLGLYCVASRLRNFPLTKIEKEESIDALHTLMKIQLAAYRRQSF